MLRLAIVSTHPIQYNAPAFRALAHSDEIVVKVFYEWEGPGKLDPEFGRPVEWDIPLLDGYEYTFVRNRSTSAGSHHFRGIDNPTLVREILEWQPDVLLLYGWAFKSHVEVLRRVHERIPILFRGDSTIVDHASPLRRFARKTVLRNIFRRINVALYAGRRNREYFEWAGVDGERLVWAPHAVDNQRFAQTSETSRDAIAWRAERNIGPQDLVYLFAGKLSPRKDPGILLDAFIDATRSLPAPSHLVFAGSGVLEQTLRNSADAADNIHFIGFQNQSRMPLVYHGADVLVLPSVRGETWGLAVNEAMAAGRAVICSDKVGCAPDLIEEGITGFIFSAGAASDLSRCLALAGNRATALSMGKAAAQLISGWSIERYASSVIVAAQRARQ